MPSWQRILTRIAVELEQRADAARASVRRRVPSRDPLTIAAYRGYGSSERVLVKGRVLEQEDIPTADSAHSAWRNALSMFRRFESDEVPGARVRATVAGASHELVTDEEGYFSASIPVTQALPADRLWHAAHLELLAPRIQGHAPVHAEAQILVPPATARLGVISDLDDTVVQTGATDTLRMARTVFLSNARTRIPFEGVATFYRALQEGAAGGEGNPLFYVSSSPWNLYDVLEEFLDLQGIPPGPLLLRDWGISREEVLPVSHGRHKTEAIRQILDLYPLLPFVLIGDSGQEDPEIYREIVGHYPGRILAVYIRSVSPAAQRHAKIAALAEEIVAAGSVLLLATDTLAAAEHAAGKALLSSAAVDAVRRVVRHA